MSMSFSANLSAYSAMPSFLSQSAICCITATKVRSCARQEGVYTGKSPIARLVKKRGRTGGGVPRICPNQMSGALNCDLPLPAIKDAGLAVPAYRELSTDAETERSPIVQVFGRRPDAVPNKRQSVRKPAEKETAGEGMGPCRARRLSPHLRPVFCTT
jgi:hypothetical protein